MAHMLETIRDEHLSMSRLLDLLEEQIEAFENGAPADYQLMNEIIEYFLTFPDLFHRVLTPKRHSVDDNGVCLRLDRHGGR